MKIHICHDGRCFTVPVPTWLLLKWAVGSGKQNAAVDALCKEVRRIQKAYPSWELAQIQSADGKEICITL